MLHTFRQTQDENCSLKQNAKQSTDNEVPQTAKKRPFGTALTNNSTRKALGNITNQAHTRTPAPPSVLRKTTGGVSNTPLSVAKQGQPRKRLQSLSNLTPNTQTASILAKPRLNEEIRAEEGVEQQAGKGWREQEKAQEALDVAERRARVRAMLTVPVPLTTVPARKADYIAVADALKSSALQRPPSRPGTPLKGVAVEVDMDLADLLPQVPSPLPRLECKDD